jgi:hypothetical protein
MLQSTHHDCKCHGRPVASDAFGATEYRVCEHGVENLMARASADGSCK